MNQISLLFQPSLLVIKIRRKLCKKSISINSLNIITHLHYRGYCILPYLCKLMYVTEVIPSFEILHYICAIILPKPVILNLQFFIFCQYNFLCYSRCSTIFINNTWSVSFLYRIKKPFSSILQQKYPIYSLALKNRQKK